MKKGNIIVIAIAVLAVAIVLIVTLRKPPETEYEPGTAAEVEEASTTKRTPRIPDSRSRQARDRQTVSAEEGPSVIAETPAPPRAGRTPAVEQFAGEDDLRAALFGDDEDRREAALNQLAGWLEEGKGREVLKELFLSKDRELQDEALILIPNLDEKYRIPYIMIGLDHEDPEYRLESLSLMRDLADPDVNEPLIKAMNDKDEEVLEEVSDLFFYFSDKPLYDSVALGLKHENDLVREEALSYLEDTHTRTSVMMLIDVLKFEDPEMVEQAAEALRFITDAEIENNDYEAWMRWWQQSGEAWAKEWADPEFEQ